MQLNLILEQTTPIKKNNNNNNNFILCYRSTISLSLSLCFPPNFFYLQYTLHYIALSNIF